MAFKMKKQLAGTERRRQIQSEDDADVLLTRAWKRSRRPLRRTRGVCVRLGVAGGGNRGGFSWRLLFVLQLSSLIRGTSGNTFRRTPRPTTIVSGGHAVSTEEEKKHCHAGDFMLSTSLRAHGHGERARSFPFVVALHSAFFLSTTEAAHSSE